ncbi:MAG: DUF2695 domain-containing protein [Longimicrobiaceae bacterium]
MAKDPDRKAKLRAWKEGQRAAREAGRRLSDRDLRELFDHLDQALEGGCDHTLAHTRHYLQSRGLDEETVLPWLAEYGGHCDCEVLANVGSEWDEA